MQMQRDILEKVGISQVEIRHLEAAWDTYQTAVAQPVHQIPHIVCTGIYNAGKSTLLNALCGEEKFPTGDIPTTKEITQAEFGGAVYIDTPGLNAMDEDDRETQTAYESADFILFVANAQNGGISSAEAEWLQKLKEQYGSLQQRLIYVLTHCSQVEPEQLLEIRKKTLDDFRKSAGLDPEWVLCVDSITYLDGVTQNELLLTENSGIPQLKSCLDERVAGAEKTMREARDAELVTRREDLAKRLEHCKKFCRNKTDGLEATLAQQKQDIKKGWSEFLSKLESVLSNRPSPYISRYMDHPSFRSYNEVKDTSESSVKRKTADCLRSRYNERESTLRKSVRQATEDLAPYLRKGPGSKYWTMCSQVNQEFEAIVLKLLQMGIPIEQGTSISVEPDLDSSVQSEIEHDLQDEVVRYDHYYSLEFYIEQECDVSEYEEQVKGLFGILTMKTMYRIYRPQDAEREWQRDMDEAWKSNCSYVERKINSVIERFMQSLTSAANDRKAALEKQLNAYLDDMKPDGNVEIYQQALEYIVQLQKEVSQ